MNKSAFLIAVCFACPGLVCSGNAVAASAPTASIANGELKATVYLPNARTGFYRATRFDWSGVISSLRYKGHDYVNPWYETSDASVRDFEFRGDRIVTGPASTMLGFPEEFGSAAHTAWGWEEAAAGGSFVKIGVGILRKPDDKPYDHYRAYEIVGGSKWVVQRKDNWVEFTQTVSDAASGYGYIYTKRVTLTPGKPQLVIEHRLRNIGTRPIQGDVYDHNFTRWDHEAPGPDYSVRFAFTPEVKEPLAAPLVIAGDTAGFSRALDGQESIRATPEGFSTEARDYDFQFENRKLGIGLRASSDTAMSRFAIWGIRSVFAVEPFIALDIPAGGEQSWKIFYDAYTVTAVPR